jgi:hypothetical protein
MKYSRASVELISPLEESLGISAMGFLLANFMNYI